MVPVSGHMYVCGGDGRRSGPYSGTKSVDPGRSGTWVTGR